MGFFEKVLFAVICSLKICIMCTLLLREFTCSHVALFINMMKTQSAFNDIEIQNSFCSAKCFLDAL